MSDYSKLFLHDLRHIGGEDLAFIKE